MKAALWPVGWIYSALSRGRSYCYDHGLKSIEGVNCPVISIGNITAGGTGKTPIIAALISWAESQNIKVGVVSRGYRGDYGKVAFVDSTDKENGASTYGDEPFMLSQRYPEVPICVAGDRLLAANTLLEKHSVDLILADDAFQHRRLKRDLDVVVLDAMESLRNYLPLPVGRAREPMSSIRRADFVVLNKINMASATKVTELLSSLEELAKSSGWSLPPIIESRYEVKSITRPNHPEHKPMTGEQKVWLVSAIGNPESFTQLVSENGFIVGGHSVFTDHHSYQSKDIAQILTAIRSEKIDRIFTTEKDYVKLAKYSELEPFLWVVSVELVFSEDMEKLYESIHRSLR